MMTQAKAKWPCCSTTIIAGLLLSLGAAACGSKDSEKIGSVYVKSGLIKAAEGGELEVPLGDSSGIGGARIAIPANALGADTTITIGIGESTIVHDSGTGVGPVIELGPAGTQFSKPVVLTVPYTGQADRRRVRVYVKQADGTMSLIPAHQIALDTVKKLVRFQVEHFTQYQCGNGMEPPPCDPANDCGPPLGLPNWTCADGSIGGPTGQCVRNDDGSCGWEVNWCEPGCTPDECGPAPMLELICADGTPSVIECRRDAMAGCSWHVECPTQCDPAPGGGGGMGGGGSPLPACMSDADCPMGFVCDPATAVCISGNGGFVPPPACTSDTDCPMGFVCAMGSCIDASGMPPPTTCGGCSDPTQCPMGTVCSNGQCEPTGQSCGPSVCGMGEYCCNESCGICAPLGGACTQQACNSCGPAGMSCPPGSTCDPMTGSCTPGTGEVCGGTQCAAGEYCCNASCGQCAPQGAACPQVACTACGPMGGTCAPGEVCDATTGQCTASCDPLACGPAPGIPNWVCADGSVGGPTGNCIPAGSSMLPPPGGMTPTPTPACVWEIVWCTPGCDPMECGPQPALPNYTCPDGMTIAGPTGQCERAADGSCGWTIIQCP